MYPAWPSLYCLTVPRLATPCTAIHAKPRLAPTATPSTMHLVHQIASCLAATATPRQDMSHLTGPDPAASCLTPPILPCHAYVASTDIPLLPYPASPGPTAPYDARPRPPCNAELSRNWPEHADPHVAMTAGPSLPISAKRRQSCHAMPKNAKPQSA